MGETDPLRALLRVGELVCSVRSVDVADPRAGVGGRTPGASQVGNLDLILCGAEIYAEQSPQTRGSPELDQNLLHIIRGRQRRGAS